MGSWGRGVGSWMFVLMRGWGGWGLLMGGFGFEFLGFWILIGRGIVDSSLFKSWGRQFIIDLFPSISRLDQAFLDFGRVG